MRQAVRLLPLTMVFLFAAPAVYAGVEAQALVGRASTKATYLGLDQANHTKDITGINLGASLALSPVPMVPVSFGVALNSTSYDTSSYQKEARGLSTAPLGYDVSGKGKLSGLTYGPEITVWLPVPGVSPYLRVGYMMGDYTDDSSVTATPTVANSGAGVKTSTLIKSTSTGTEVGAGIRINPLPLVGLLIEYQMVNEKHKVKSDQLTVGGVSTSIDPDKLPSSYRTTTFSAAVIRIGVQVGI